MRGGWSGIGMVLVWIDPNYVGSLCSNPNKIQTNDMVGGVMYFCQQSNHQHSPAITKFEIIKKLVELLTGGYLARDYLI